MNTADDLVKAFNDGYEKGKADAEFYLTHCGDTDEPMTNADCIRAMSDEELGHFLQRIEEKISVDAGFLGITGWLTWLKREVTDDRT